MWFLQSTTEDTFHYLWSQELYTIGRKNTDIIISNDDSVSRTHAILNLKADIVKLMDKGSKYGTHINGRKLEPNDSELLAENTEIKIGLLESVFRLKRLKLIVVTSNVSANDKSKLCHNIAFLKGKRTSKWVENCTHFVASNLILTAKLLCALTTGKPIVNVQYFNDLVESVKNNKALPNTSDYLPNLDETILNKNIKLEYNPARKTLFNGKIFVFLTEKAKVLMEDCIMLTGGKAIAWETSQISLSNLKNPKYIVINETVDDEIENSQLYSSFKRAINYLLSIDKRAIPLQEIALAIVHCSCEKDCNPFFDRAGTLIAQETQKPNSEILHYATEALEDFNTQNNSEAPEALVVLPSYESEITLTSRQKSVKKSFEHEALPSTSKSATNLVSEASTSKGGRTLEPEVSTSKIASTLKSTKTLEPEASTSKSANDVNTIASKTANLVISSTSTSERSTPSIFKNTQNDFITSASKSADNVISCASTANSNSLSLFKSASNASRNMECEIINIASNSDITLKRNLASDACFSASKRLKESQQSTDSEFSMKRSNKQTDKASVFSFPKSTATMESSVKTELVENPFSRKRKASVDLEKVSKKVPFENIGNIIHEKPKENPKSRDFLSSTALDNDFSTISNKNGPNISAIFNKSSNWIMCNTTIKQEQIEDLTKDLTPEEEQLAKWNASFKNSIVVEVKDLVVRKPSVANDVTAAHATTTNGGKNFKKFKKVEPLHMQTKIIPRSKMNIFIIGENHDYSHLENVDEPEEIDEDVEELLSRREERIQQKGNRRKFAFK